jgi:hypothetical protein
MLSDAPLPSRASIVEKYGLFNSGEEACHPRLDAGGSLGCRCTHCGRWKQSLRTHEEGSGTVAPQYEVFNEDHVSALARYVSRRVQVYREATDTDKITLLEVGAGSGLLSRLHPPGPNLYPGGCPPHPAYAAAGTSSVTWRHWCPMLCASWPPTLARRSFLATSIARCTKCPTGRLSFSDMKTRSLNPNTPCHEQALEKFRPTIVVACWMVINEVRPLDSGPGGRER